LDPRTQQWTVYNLPAHGTNTRFITVDNRKDSVEVWAASFMTSKVIRLQFRTKEQMQAAASSLSAHKSSGWAREDQRDHRQERAQN
jgi:streptogramin lyase